MISEHRNALIFGAKVFGASRRTLSLSQKFALLISNTNIDDPRFARFQPSVFEAAIEKRPSWQWGPSHPGARQARRG
jgi:hypothetical protein